MAVSSLVLVHSVVGAIGSGAGPMMNAPGTGAGAATSMGTPSTSYASTVNFPTGKQ